MIVSINQPAYLPWLGYFDRIRRSDLHIVLDHVQFEKGSYTNRCRIRQRDGREMWLTVPVGKGHPICLTSTPAGWTRKHRAALRQAYGIEPPLFESHLLMPTLDLAARWLAAVVGVPFDVLFSSRLRVPGRKSDLVLNLCKEVGATQYLSGPQGRNYLDIPAFEKAGIEVLYHDFPADGDWGLSAVHHLSRSFEWPQLDLTSAHSSQDSALAAAA